MDSGRYHVATGYGTKELGVVPFFVLFCSVQAKSIPCGICSTTGPFVDFFQMFRKHNNGPKMKYTSVQGITGYANTRIVCAVFTIRSW